MKIGFDVISDLNLSPDETFNWEGKATSLYCVIAGNLSSDLRTIHQTLSHLSKFYQGVFYIAGTLEFKENPNTTQRVAEIYRLCKGIQNVAFLHNHVVIIDGIAIVGVNGWAEKYPDNILLDIHSEINQQDDLSYLRTTVEKLQLHLDVRSIFIVSHGVPSTELFFGEEPKWYKERPQLVSSLETDSEHKVKHWAFGSYNKEVDTTINGINYINNSYYKRKPYWAKRIDI